MDGKIQKIFFCRGRGDLEASKKELLGTGAEALQLRATLPPESTAPAINVNVATDLCRQVTPLTLYLVASLINQVLGYGLEVDYRLVWVLPQSPTQAAFLSTQHMTSPPQEVDCERDFQPDLLQGANQALNNHASTSPDRLECYPSAQVTSPISSESHLYRTLVR